MNIATIGTQLSALADKITEERGAGQFSKQSLLDAIKAAREANEATFSALENEIHAQFDGRDTGLADMLQHPDAVPAEQEKAA